MAREARPPAPGNLVVYQTSPQPTMSEQLSSSQPSASKQSLAPRSVEPEAKTRPDETVENQPSNTGVTTSEKWLPVMTSRSCVALWMSCLQLIRQHPGDVWLWTFTFAEVLPSHYAANVHRNFMTAIANAKRGSSWPKAWGGVKVPEFHPSGHGIHFHWLAYPRMNVSNVRAIAESVGFGRIHVHPEPATERAANYISKYLIKGGTLSGLKSWGTLGDYEGVRVKDVLMESASINVYRTAYREAIAAGKPKGAAFLHAKKIQRQFDCS